jgi:hypothetical protein
LLTSLSEYSPNVSVPFGGINWDDSKCKLVIFKERGVFYVEYSFEVQTNLLVIGDFAWKLELLVPAKYYKINNWLGSIWETENSRHTITKQPHQFLAGIEVNVLIRIQCEEDELNIPIWLHEHCESRPFNTRCIFTVGCLEAIEANILFTL